MTLRRALCAFTLVLMFAAVAGDADAARRAHHPPTRRAPAHRAAAHAQPAQPPGAKHVTILDGDTGLVLYCDDCNTPIQPASMSKLMTVLVVADALEHHQISMDTHFTVSENAWRHGPTARESESNMFLNIGSSVSVRDLLQGVIVVSANDACITLAEGIAGSEDAFVVRMNQRAQQLGLTTARFRNVTGLPDPEHVISSADLARLAAYMIRNEPELYRIYSERAFTFNGHPQQNRNPLLGAFPGADGFKTGHTDAAGYSLVGSAIVDSHRRIIVFNGTRSMEERRAEGLRLMRAAFNDYDARRIAAAGGKVGEAQVYLGSSATVPLVAQTQIAVGGPRSTVGALRAHIRYSGPLTPPIKKGDIVAHLVIAGPPGFTPQEYPLAAGADIGRANWFARAWEGLRLTLSGGH
jgi:D-alanyl-D-alanine carboxypeptidase (penicillin-binding protein 5/6)